MAKGRKSKGLGDTVEKITKATGIKKAVEVISEATGVDCGCDSRKEFLNKLWSYRKPNCIKEEDVEFLLPFLDFKKSTLTPKEQWRIKDIYLYVFNEELQDSNCDSCWRDILNDLRKVYQTQNA